MYPVIYYFTHLLSTEGLPPRWLCGFWSPFQGWFYILSDIGIWSAYFAIPVLLLYFIRQRSDLPFPKIFWLFAAFILACGLTHLMDATLFWWPAYRLAGLLYFATASVSWVTVFALVPVIPQALALKSPALLEQELHEHKAAEAQLVTSNQAIQALERKRTEGFIKELRDVKFALDQSTIVAITDKKGNITYVNEAFCKISKYAENELLGQNHRIINSGYHSHEFFVSMWKTIGHGSVWKGEIKNRAKDRTLYWVDTTIVPFLDENGKPYQYIAIRHDITARKCIEEENLQLNTELEKRVKDRTAQLKAANKELEAFAYSVSHDLRAPLRGIDGFGQALLEQYKDQLDEQGKHYLNRVRENSQRMGHLIDDMLKLSQLTRGEMHFEAIDLSALVKTIIRELQETEPERQVMCMIADGVTGRGDKHLLQVVLQNLLDNAWKYTSKNQSARIEFGMVEHDGEMAYFVKDDGSGFDMKYAGKLFTPFQRLHGITEFDGTGVGLATVARIIHRHGGKIWAQAEIEKGATFYFTLNSDLQETEEKPDESQSS